MEAVLCISQSAMLFELMHRLGENIMIPLNGKYYENIEKSKFLCLCLQVKKKNCSHTYYTKICLGATGWETRTDGNLGICSNKY